MPTTTLVSQPQFWSPCEGDYSYLWYCLTSASSSTTDFKYVVDLSSYEIISNTTTVLGRYKVPPRPITGYGWFNASKVIQTQLSYDLFPNTYGFTARSNSLKVAKLRYGFEYNPSLKYIGSFNSSTYLGLTFSAAHGLLPGDLIMINKDDKTLNPQYDGTASITSTATYSFITNKLYGVVGVETGAIASILRMTGTASDIQAFNGTRQYEQAQLNFSLYDQTTTGSPFLTNYPFSGNSDSPAIYVVATQSKSVSSTDKEVVSFLCDTGLVTNAYIQEYNTYGTLIATASMAYSVSSTYYRIDLGVGPANLAGNGYPLNVNTTNYTITLQKAPDEPGPKSPLGMVAYKLNKNCSPWKNTRLAFLNRLGGFDYMNFNWKSKNTVTTTKNEFKHQLSPNYTVGERESTVLSSASFDMWMISTDFISETEGYWLKELLQSSEVYVVKDDGSYLPIIITDTSYEVKVQLIEKLFAFTVNFKYAYQSSSQGN